MRLRGRLISALALSCVAAFGIAACGGGGGGGGAKSAGAPSSGGKSGGTITWLQGTAPDSLDPGFGYTTQSLEATEASYLPLVTYAHQPGQAGTKLIPALADALPTVSADGKTYTMTLRKGLVYSNGKPVKASDFKYSIERSIRIPWGGKSFYTSYIAGASAYDSHKASSISGIVTDDATGKITIKLTQPYGAFANVLAFPSSALVPTGTPMKNEPVNVPAGVGPYMITNVKPNVGYTLQKNPQWSKMNIPGIPAGHLDTINVQIQGNTNTEAESVLNNSADVFDPGDVPPGALLNQARTRAGSRFTAVPTLSTFYFFLNTRTKPFNNKLAREAVNYALDKSAMVKLASGLLKPACHFIPEGMVGHVTAPCPYYGSGNAPPTAGPNLAKAKALVKQAGLTGTPVTVWGETRQPRQQYVLYYTSVLNKIGFKATPKIIADATYFPTVGSAHTNPQTGFADWLDDFPNPSDFYLLMDCKTIQPVNNENFSNVCDPKIQFALKNLNPIPATKLDSVGADWQKLDQYTSSQAYQLVYGQELLPKFTSDRINFQTAYLHPVFQMDVTALQLK